MVNTCRSHVVGPRSARAVPAAASPVGTPLPLRVAPCSCFAAAAAARACCSAARNVCSAATLTPAGCKATCAAMNKAGLVYGCGTEDMDVLTFGCKKMLRHLHKSEAQKLPIMEIDVSIAIAEMGEQRSRQTFHSERCLDRPRGGGRGVSPSCGVPDRLFASGLIVILIVIRGYVFRGDDGPVHRHLHPVWL